MDLNDVKSDMASTMGQSVPKIKAIVSHDYTEPSGQNVPMGEDFEMLTEKAWRAAFMQRLREVQGARTQQDMADLLGISRDSWNKYVNRGSEMPIFLLPKLAKIGAVSLEWLIEGPRQKSAARPASEKRKRA